MRKLPPMGAIEHSLRSTFDNLGFAFHVSWPWMLAILPFNVIGNTYVTLHQSSGPQNFGVGVFLVSLGIGVLGMIAFSSIAVLWHRYILLDEVPQGLARLRLDSTVWRYIGNIILIMLMGIGAAIPLVIVFAILAAALAKFAVIPMVLFGSVYFLVLMNYAFRLSIKLPAIALGRHDYLFRTALTDTAGNFWPFLGFMLLQLLIAGLIAGVLGLMAYAIGKSDSAVFIAVMVAIDLVVNWLMGIWGITILTSFYGYFVEGRKF